MENSKTYANSQLHACKNLDWECHTHQEGVEARLWRSAHLAADIDYLEIRTLCSQIRVCEHKRLEIRSLCSEMHICEHSLRITERRVIKSEFHKKNIHSRSRRTSGRDEQWTTQFVRIRSTAVKVLLQTHAVPDIAVIVGKLWRLRHQDLPTQHGRQPTARHYCCCCDDRRVTKPNARYVQNAFKHQLSNNKGNTLLMSVAFSKTTHEEPSSSLKSPTPNVCCNQHTSILAFQTYQT